MNERISRLNQRTIPIHIIRIPYHLPSEANISDHWTKKHKRKKRLQLLLLSYWPAVKIELPCVVTLTRVAPRSLDYDNLVYAFKNTKDFIADKIVPGRAAGRADDDDRISWEYGQKKGIRPNEYAIIVRIESKF